jgi:hypothetical protein
MNLSDLRFPRQLEADGSEEKIRLVLAAEPVKLWSGGSLEVPRVAMTDQLEKALRTALLGARIRCGVEGIRAKLEHEGVGIENVKRQNDALYGERVSRLLFFANDGAERFYRQIEMLLTLHAPRILGIFLDVDGSVLGKATTGKESIIKCVMAEHKDAVSAILRAIAAGPGPWKVHGG